MRSTTAARGSAKPPNSAQSPLLPSASRVAAFAGDGGAQPNVPAGAKVDAAGGWTGTYATAPPPRSVHEPGIVNVILPRQRLVATQRTRVRTDADRKSTRLNSSHV